MAQNHKQSLPRFLVVGGANTVVDFGLLLVLTHLGAPALVANTISTGIAFVFSFFANKKYTFSGGGTNIRREMALFTVVTLFGLWVIQAVIIGTSKSTFAAWLGSDQLGLFAAKILATVASMIWNYLLYSKLVFKKH